MAENQYPIKLRISLSVVHVINEVKSDKLFLKFLTLSLAIPRILFEPLGIIPLSIAKTFDTIHADKFIFVKKQFF